MKIEQLEYMQSQYGGNRDFEPEDLEKKNSLKSKFKYSLILEGDLQEFEVLDKWINETFEPDSVEHIFYGKTDYDHGFAEYFINEASHFEKIKLAILTL